MRIAYGIHGYGRGHSSRALAVLPDLAARHELLVLAGDDAHEALHGEYPVRRVPVLRYALGPEGRRSARRTLTRAAPHLLDLALHGAGVGAVCRTLERFAPDVVVSDSEPWTHHAARRLKLPRISFDHFGVLAYCRWPMSRADRLICRLESAFYRRLMAAPSERVVIVSFYPAPPRRRGVRVVGPVLREMVRRQRPSRGDYLLVYFSNGRHHFTPRVEAALGGLDLPVVVYGIGREGVAGGIDFRPPSNVRFVEDLARCRAVFATAGNQLISEALFFRKPMLLLPEDSLEQRLNATAVERMGVGRRACRRSVGGGMLRAFLDAEANFVARMPVRVDDGRARAVEAIEGFAAELAGDGRGIR